LTANKGRPTLKISTSSLTGDRGSNLKHFCHPECLPGLHPTDYETNLDFLNNVSASIFDVALRLHTFAKFDNIFTI
jgi:hypothetical protein